ncbi:MAG: alpha/beta fold hydrolase [Porticoccaceae bacterium]
MTPVEHAFSYDGLRIAATEWGHPAGTPVLALHGWLDNCGSFAPLGRLLRQVRLIALDLPGHGHSSHRSADGTYNIWQDVGVVHAVAEQLGWERFALLGHSRGAMICTLTAGTFPERVSHLGLLDSFVPATVATADEPEQLRGAILDRAARGARCPGAASVPGCRGAHSDPVAGPLAAVGAVRARHRGARDGADRGRLSLAQR